MADLYQLRQQLAKCMSTGNELPDEFAEYPTWYPRKRSLADTSTKQHHGVLEMDAEVVMGLELARFEGCLMGLACGDAVGKAVEFMPRGDSIRLPGCQAEGSSGCAKANGRTVHPWRYAWRKA